MLHGLHRDDAARRWRDHETDSGKSALMPGAIAQRPLADGRAHEYAPILSNCDPLHRATQIH